MIVSCHLSWNPNTRNPVTTRCSFTSLPKYMEETSQGAAMATSSPETLAASQESSQDSSPYGAGTSEETSQTSAGGEFPQGGQSDRALLAGKYENVDELEKAYQHSNSEAGRMAQRLSQMEQEMARLKMTPDEVAEYDRTQQFIKRFGLMTKEEYLQMQKDERDAQFLISRGASQSQIDRVREISRFGDYAKKSLAEIFQLIYGQLPREKPKMGITQRPRGRDDFGQYTPEELSAMSYEDMKKNLKDIMAKGVRR